MAIKRGWVGQREFARSRVDWILSGMSLRTQEAARAARMNREPNFNTVGIIAEDVEYAIRHRSIEEFNRFFIPHPVDLVNFDLNPNETTIDIVVRCSDGDYFHRIYHADTETIVWLKPVFYAALAQIETNKQSAKKETQS